MKWTSCKKKKEAFPEKLRKLEKRVEEDKKKVIEGINKITGIKQTIDQLNGDIQQATVMKKDEEQQLNGAKLNVQKQILNFKKDGNQLQTMQI